MWNSGNHKISYGNRIMFLGITYIHHISQILYFPQILEIQNAGNMIFQNSINHKLAEIMDFWKQWTSITVIVFHCGAYIHTHAYVYMNNNNVTLSRLHSILTVNNSTYVVSQKLNFIDHC